MIRWWQQIDKILGNVFRVQGDKHYVVSGAARSTQREKDSIVDLAAFKINIAGSLENKNVFIFFMILSHVKLKRERKIAAILNGLNAKQIHNARWFGSKLQ